MPKWLLPVLIAAGAAVGLWILFSDRGRAAVGFAPRRPSAGGALCTTGAVFTMGPSGLMTDPLCQQLGPALDPLIESGVGLGKTTFDTAGRLIDATGRVVSGAVQLPLTVTGKVLGAAEDVVHDAYGAVKDTVGFFSSGKVFNPGSWF